MKKFVITAAGGNATAIGIIETPQERSWYEAQGSALMSEFENFSVEQVGFIVLSQNHFEMSGSEFCGNGSRAAGLLFCMLNGGIDEFTFTTSGHKKPVTVKIDDIDSATPFAIGIFPGLNGVAEVKTLSSGQEVKVVDLGGIVHVIIDKPLPPDYETEHRRVTAELGFSDRAAVGVDWVTTADDKVYMHPVVWVKSIDTFFYETSCGSGSISAAIATNIDDIVQPSGKTIVVGRLPDALSISSYMEVVHVNSDQR
jgi:histidine racemase